MRPPLRKLVLTAHITFAVGWLGAVASFLALAIAGLTSQDAQRVRAAYLAMESMTRFVIVPLSFAPLLTGPILSSRWGLFRHYWILVKLLITLVCAMLMLVHLHPISYMAGVAAERTLSSSDLHPLRFQLVPYAGAALVALLVTTTLSVYKPRGVTPYGWRMQQAQQTVSPPGDAAS